MEDLAQRAEGEYWAVLVSTYVVVSYACRQCALRMRNYTILCYAIPPSRPADKLSLGVGDATNDRTFDI